MNVITEDKARGSRLDKAIRESSLSRAEIAKKLNVTPQAIWKWCKTGKISRENLLQLATILKIDASFLNKGEGSPRTSKQTGEISAQKLSGALRLVMREHGEDLLDIPIDTLSAIIANEYNSLPD